MADTAPRRCRVCGQFEPDLREHNDAQTAARQALTRCSDAHAAEADRARSRITSCERLKAGVRKAPRFFQPPFVSRNRLSYGARGR
ncbi:MAG: hypothetical protein LC796_13085 [Acidobacteria bacterium]|nr:hypothetical protein [Acidobacteriota bacterium]MCA1612071.1 hypothetical protein [Acidobacteriota bacterium]